MPQQSLKSPLILASTSASRKSLLDRLGIQYIQQSPDMDETPSEDEAPQALVNRLAHGKAASIAQSNPDAVVIGSDQISVCDRLLIGKSGSIDRAIAQLDRFSGRTVDFFTAVCVMRLADGFCESHLDHTTVTFRALTIDEIERYLAAEPAIECAGSFKAESLGISLFDQVTSKDPTALPGLPLIATARLLREAGFNVP
jgi:septum formation protein